MSLPFLTIVEDSIMLIVVAIVIFALTLVFIISRIKKCPADKIMVIYGHVGINKDGTSRSATCIHGGSRFIYPIIQAYQFLDLKPLSIDIELEKAISKDKELIGVNGRFSVGISTESGVMQNAAERLLGLPASEIEDLSKDIIFGQLRIVIATMDFEEFKNRDMFFKQVCNNVETEIKKIGLRLINANVTDISDEFGVAIR